MEELSMIEKTIASLKLRLEQNNHVLTLQLENGYITEAKCRFFKPVTEYETGSKNYMFIKAPTEHFKDGRALNTNFELWFDRFIVSQGTKFWK